MIRSILAALTLFITLTASAQTRTSPFEYHGIVEGFYGAPWTHEARLETIRFMGEVGYNTFFYAPKDDPYHRSRWRDPYPAEELARFRELFNETQQAGVTLYYAISPGLSIEYSSDEDYEALIAKIDAMMEQGVRHFALFVDDVPEELAHASDQARFDNLGEAHVYLINRLYADLQERGAEFILTPTTYTTAWGDREYIRILGEGIPQEIPVFWTGMDVAVEQITAEEARQWGQLMDRKPLIWDNFPVNDYDPWRPYVGPLRGRDPQLYTETRGLIANPNVEPYLSMVPLYTVADYVQDPEGYDPDASWHRALEYLYGEEAAAALAPVLALYADFGWEENLFRPLYAPGRRIELTRIEQGLEAMDDVTRRLRGGRFAANVRLQGALDELEKFEASTRERLATVLETTGYVTFEEDGLRYVEYDPAYDLFEANRAKRVDIGDGRLCDWNGYAFHPLYGGADARAAFQFDDDYLYVAVDVRDGSLEPSGAHTLYEGDHVVLVVDYDPANPAQYIKEGDVVLQVGAPSSDAAGSEAMLATMAFTEHHARGATDLQRTRLSHFFQFPAVEPGPEHAERFSNVRHAVHRTDDGYTVEFAVPREGMHEMRLDIGVFDVDTGEGGRTVRNGSLSRRGYILNPQAYATVRIPESM